MPPALLIAPLVAGAGALLFGWFAVRLSGVYLAMLTLAFAQIVWAIVFQWEDLTGGSNGVLGIWPTAPFETRARYYLLTLALTVVGVLVLWRMLFAPFGYAMRAGRDSPLRAEAIGINVKRVHWIGFAIAGVVGGLAGALFAFAKGLDLARDHRRRPLGRRHGDGAARRLADPGRAGGRRLGVRGAAGHHHAPDRILARAARRHHPDLGAGVPARPGRLGRAVLRQRAKAQP